MNVAEDKPLNYFEQFYQVIALIFNLRNCFNWPGLFLYGTIIAVEKLGLQSSGQNSPKIEGVIVFITYFIQVVFTS